MLLPLMFPLLVARGDERHIMLGWKYAYKQFGWHQYAAFNTRGGVNAAYGLFKAKNVCDPVVRATKWMKMRPIAPSTKHPMRVLLRRAGKAWHFISTHIQGEHFVINSTRDVPATRHRNMKSEYEIGI